MRKKSHVRYMFIGDAPTLLVKIKAFEDEIALLVLASQGRCHLEGLQHKVIK